MQNEQDLSRHLHPGQVESIVHPLHHVIKAKERMYTSNKYLQSFNSLAFGSGQIPLSIPREQVIHGVTVNMTFQGVHAADALDAMPGYNAIDRIDYKMAGSTLYSYDGPSLFHIARSMCSTSDQVTELVSLAGGPIAQVLGIATLQTSIFIPLPWSRLNAAFVQKARYGVDSSILEQPIQIFISLKPAARVYTVNTGANSALAAANFRILGSNYLYNEDRMLPKEGHLFSFPCFYYQPFQTASFTPASATDNISTQFTGFRKGGLVGLLLNSIDNANSSGTAGFKLNQIRNLRIQFNGVNVYYEYGNDARMTQLTNSLSPATYAAYSQTNRTHEVWFSNLPARYSQFNFMSGLNLSSQTLTADFTIADSTNAQKLQVIYVYRAMLCYNAHTAELVL